MEQTFDRSLDCAVELDRADGLADLRKRFAIPDSNGAPAVYLCGHSLGLMPLAARAAVAAELDAWSARAVGAHFGADGGWYAYHERFAAPLAGLLGVDSGSVVAMNSLTVNLHLMLASFFTPNGERRRIVIERGAFPSDRYAVRSQLRWHGCDPDGDLIELEPAAGALTPAALDTLLAGQAGQVALVMLPGVQFLTGQALDVGEFAAVIRRHGAIAGFDLAHSIGNLPEPLAGGEADFAVWCSYKYLNGGPGAIGGCYVNPRWHDASLPRLEGWWGHDKARRFALEERFHPIASAEAWQLSNPPILAMAPLATSLALFREAGTGRLREKSLRQTAYLRWLLEDGLGERAAFLTPASADDRGCQLSIRLHGTAGGNNVIDRLTARNVIADWREPDILRLAPVPLYNSFTDIHAAAAALIAALDA